MNVLAHALRGELHHRGVDVGVAYLSWTDTYLVRGAATVPAMARMRSRLPWPVNQTWPLEPTVARIAAGLDRRAGASHG